MPLHILGFSRFYLSTLGSTFSPYICAQVLARKMCANTRDELLRTPILYLRKPTLVLARKHMVE
ncbi:hypothetical protein E2C01_054256 [Portunus trituberculatus]|uniref:Uncharacterized protein n=1 Tax=Portunus trituberculatus TaxID=210409 RepID=A0A5B7GSP7_PORTR|nr:hypothetical protein [Portunus trituberculatus]